MGMGRGRTWWGPFPSVRRCGWSERGWAGYVAQRRADPAREGGRGEVEVDPRATGVADPVAVEADSIWGRQAEELRPHPGGGEGRYVRGGAGSLPW